MEGAKEFNILYELMLKTGCTLSDKVETKENYYSVNNGELIVAAKAINESVIKNIISDKPKKVIILDELFENNDQLKTNTALQMKDAGIEFRTM
jgi:adenine-specific DNA-methyltransferase